MCPIVSFGSTNVPEFHKLRSVLLSHTIVDSEYFTNCSSRFPRLEDLTLDHCTVHGSIQISSQSLKYFQLYNEADMFHSYQNNDTKVHKLVFDVPNIRKFVFYTTCDHVPSLSFSTKSMGWESEVRFSCSLFAVQSSWFVGLREFLNELSSSRISLDVNFDQRQLIWVKDLPCLPTPVVENLRVNTGTRPMTQDLLCDLFHCCRPTFISLRPPLDSFAYSYAKHLHDLCIMNKNIADCAKYLNKKLPSLLMYDLEEIDLEMLEGKRWQSIPLSKFVEDVDPEMLEGKGWQSIPLSESDDPKYEDIRFRLKWGAFRSCTSWPASDPG